MLATVFPLAEFDLGQWFSDNLPTILSAAGILVGGTVLAFIIAWVVGAVIRKTGLDDRLHESFSEEDVDPPSVSKQISRIVFWVLMLVVVVAMFSVLNLEAISVPLNNFLNQIFAYLPRLLAAGLLILAAWLLATVLRFLTRKVLRASGVDERLGREAGLEEVVVEEEESNGKKSKKKKETETATDPVPATRPVGLTATLSEAVYWLVWLLFFPALLEWLGISVLLAPVQNLVSQVVGFLPKLLAAAVILIVGWFVARILQRIVTNLLVAVGTDRFAERIGASNVIGQNSLSQVIGVIVHIMILIPVIIAALNALQVEAITAPASAMLANMLEALPRIFAAIVIVTLAVIGGKLLANLVSNVLNKIGFDDLFVKLGLIEKVPTTRSKTSAPSEIAGTVVMVTLIVLALMQAFHLMHFETLAGLMRELLVFAGQILFGVVIFTVGLYFANLAFELIDQSKLKSSRQIAWVARVAILVLAATMALHRMGVAPEIVTLAFGLTLGAIAVASAIAFGIGGRDAAKDIVDRYVGNGNGGSSKKKSSS